VLDHGEIVEQGTHHELIRSKGIYADLVAKQKIETGSSGSIEHDESFLQEKQSLNLAKPMNKDDSAKISTSIQDDEKQTIDAYATKFKKDDELKELLNQRKAPVWKVFMHMRPEWKYLGWGIAGSILAGCVFPLYAYSFSNIISILSIPGQEIQPSPLGGTNFYAFIFAIIGVAAFIGNGSQFMAFEICGQIYSKRLRGQVFSAYLKQEIGFFDLEENSTGSLTSKLAVDSKNVNEMITKVWGDAANLSVTVLVGLLIAFTHSWALTLITLCMSPFLVAATAYEFFLQRGFEDSTKMANAQSGQIAGEAIREVKTVVALNKQSYFEDRYYKATEIPHRLATRKAYLSSIGSACSKGISIYTNALAFYAGTRLIMNGSINFQQMFISMTVIMTTAETAGRSTTFASAFSKAKIAAIACFEILERQSLNDPDLEGLEPTVDQIQGSVEYRDITFCYPTRPDIPIFNGEFNLKGHAGKSIALVGPSGGGKSTVVGMLQRWYDPVSGFVCLDDNNVKNYTLGNLRSHMALVGQEPVLFDLTIVENICFGADDYKSVTQEDVEAAAKAANIHMFISSLPDGYNTRIGDKGSQLSGGQKQRIAIARALIRKPKVLLLDEATSALDSASEKLVQTAINDIIEEGVSTTITIAHRLSTIQNADLICVVKHGRVIEQGTHWELLKLNGTYSELVYQQSLNAH
jgi:ATP-binding cassette subfamily B (MDR/TAP) protein 1